MANLVVHVAPVKAGETVQFRPTGNSMNPKIKSGQLVTVEPIGKKPPEEGEVIFCKVKGKVMLHECTAVKGKQYRISPHHQKHHNGWVTMKSVYGRVTKVED